MFAGGKRVVALLALVTVVVTACAPGEPTELSMQIAVPDTVSILGIDAEECGEQQCGRSHRVRLTVEEAIADLSDAIRAAGFSVTESADGFAGGCKPSLGCIWVNPAGGLDYDVTVSVWR